MGVAGRDLTQHAIELEQASKLLLRRLMHQGESNLAVSKGGVVRWRVEDGGCRCEAKGCQLPQGSVVVRIGHVNTDSNGSVQVTIR